MKWTTHIDKIVKKLIYLLFVFKKLKYILRRNSILMIYYGIFHSIATYGVITWGNAYGNAMNGLEKLQRWVL